MNDDSDSDFSEFEDIRPYFPQQQWKDMSNYEKGSYRNSEKNYQLMRQAGLVPRPPQFIVAFQEREARLKKASEAAAKAKASKKSKRKRADSSDGDDSWTPQVEGKAGPSRRAKFVPPSRSKAAQQPKKVTKKATVAKKVKVAVPAESGPAEKQVQEAPVPEHDSEPRGRYPKRAGSRKCYAGADEDLADDTDLCKAAVGNVSKTG